MIRAVAGMLSPSRFPPAPLHDKNETICAVVLKEHGAAENLLYQEDFPAPTPNPKTRHVVVAVSHAGLNPVDFKMRKYNISDFAYPKPKILGSDISGRVLFAPKGSTFAVGDRVFGMLPLLGSQFGGYASRCCIDESFLCRAPENVSLRDLASIPLVACTIVVALRAVVVAFKGETTGKKCFIQAGSGGVGTFAIQYCANVLGMYVSTTCSPRNFDLVRSLGATEVIDYHTENIEDRIQDFDIFIDTLGYATESIVLDTKSKILKRDGPQQSHYIRIASSPYNINEHGSEPKLMTKDPLGMAIPEASIFRVMQGFSKQFFSSCSKVRYHFILVRPDRSALEEAAVAMRDEKIRAIIQEVIPLQDVVRAHRELESGHVTGKLVLSINESLV